MKERLRGVFAPITTPFATDGSVAYDDLKRNMEKYTASKLHGYLALGSNGENKSLTRAEKEQVLDIIVKGKGKDQIVMAGSIFESTMETIEFARRAEEIGVDYITLLPPSYFAKQMTEAALIRYFCDVADAVSVPCLVYCAPQFSAGITLSAEVVRQVAKHHNIHGLKDSSTGNINNYTMAAPEDFAIMAGSANFFFNALLLGATGGVISLANVFPDYTVSLYEATFLKDYPQAIELNKKILRLNKAVSGRGGVAAVKAAMDLAGFCGGEPRLPLLPMKREDVEAMKATLEKEGML